MAIYIVYDEPPRSWWRLVLLGLGVALALAILAALVIGFLWVVNQDSGPRTATPPAPEDAVPLQEAVPSLYESDTNTIFLVDASQSISDTDNLDVVRESLLQVVLPYIDPDVGTQAENSRAALVTFTTDTKELIPLMALDGDPAAQTQWLQTVRDLETEDEGALILDAVDDAHEMLIAQNDSARSNVIVLLTDGSRVVSEVDRATLVEKLKDSQVNELTVHTIGLGEEADHGTLMVLSKAAENGRYIYASR
jgi:Mg-chelatase subunit ChlD